MLNIKFDYSNKLNSLYSLFIWFSYNPEYVELIKKFKPRSWNPVDKCWELDFKCFNDFFDYLNSHNIPYNGNQLKEQINEFKKNIFKPDIKLPDLDNVSFKTTPYKYQLEGIKYGLNSSYLLCDEPGLGKTLQTINIACLNKIGKHCLVIVGYDALKFNWVYEIRKHSNEDGYVLGQTLKNKKWVVGSVKKRFEDLQNIDNIKEYFIITTITTLRQYQKINYTEKGVEKTEKNYYIADYIEELCRKGIIGRIIFDELHVCRNYKNDQAQSLLRLKSAYSKIGATGTPVINSNLDLYPMLSWLGVEDMNYYEFQERYCIMGGYQNKQIIGNKNELELYQKLQGVMLRRRKDDVLDLPDKIIINEYLDMEGEQYALYQKTLSQYKAQLAQQKGNRNTLLAMFLNLRKITCHPSWLNEGYVNSVKYDRILQILQEAVSNNRKTLIFSNYTTPFTSPNTTLNLFGLLKNFNPALIIGETRDRMEQVNKFQNDKSCKVMLGQISTMGTGLTLTEASNVIFLDEPWNQPVKNQGIDRTHRIGTKHSVNVYTLMCKDTVDIMVHNIVLKKGVNADKMVDRITTEELEQFFTLS